jgi:hypothetical protein
VLERCDSERQGVGVVAYSKLRCKIFEDDLLAVMDADERVVTAAMPLDCGGEDAMPLLRLQDLVSEG